MQLCAIEEVSGRLPAACTSSVCPALLRGVRPHGAPWNQSGFLSIDGQDEWLFRAIFEHYPAAGFFVEMGGFHPVSASNTWFYEACLGWRGLVIEPQSRLLRPFRVHREAAIDGSCVGDVEGEAVSFLMAGGGLEGLGGVDDWHANHSATIDRRARAFGGSPARHKERQRMRCRTLATIFASQAPRRARRLFQPRL